MKKVILILSVALFIWSCQSKYETGNFITLDPEDSPQEIVKKAAHVTPSERQLAWQDMEYTAFCHFGINTFTNREWGDGKEDPAWFNPTNFDAKQWVKTFYDAGMKMVIVTAKHHDGFCLFPSAFTDHSVESSPWMGGKGDVVKEVKDACDEFGLKFGVYLSPWDRNSQVYGSDQYNDYFVNQLTELLTNYGVVDEVWFDGACGEGPNGKRQVYDWIRYYETIRELQPQAVIAIMGPDVRWVGTESGYGRVMEWSVVPYEAMDTESIASNSQQDVSKGIFIPTGDKMAKDLGSRNKIRNAKSLIWYPSEVDVSIRPGWFYHASQDEAVKTPEKLLDIWFSSVGRNSLLLLNIPPDKRGRIHENDVEALLSLKKLKDLIFEENLADGASAKASSSALGHKPGKMLTPGRETYWMAKKGETEADIEFNLPEGTIFDCLTLCENIELGQRVEQFSLEVWTGERWREVTRSTTIGNKRMLRFSPQKASKIRIRILQARHTPALAFFAIHKRPPQLDLNPPGGAFMKTMDVELKTDLESNKIYYTLDGSDPDEYALKYTQPVSISETSQIKAIAYDTRGAASFIREGRYTQATFSISYKHAPSPKYPGNSQITLMDGIQGGLDFATGEYLGWEGDDMVVTVDFGSVKNFRKVTSSFIGATGSWIFLPREVKVEVSTNGTFFRPMGTTKNSRAWNSYSDGRREAFTVSNFVEARYVRVSAKSMGICPKGHAGEGGKAWLFCDEIILE